MKQFRDAKRISVEQNLSMERLVPLTVKTGKAAAAAQQLKNEEQQKKEQR